MAGYEAMMAALRATAGNPEAQVIVAEIIRQAQAAEAPRGLIPKRQIIYLEPDAKPLEVFNVDAKEWIASGAARALPWDPTTEKKVAKVVKPSKPEPAASAAEPEPGAVEEATAAPSEPDLEALDTAELRKLWKAAHPGQKVPPRAGSDWFLTELRG